MQNEIDENTIHGVIPQARNRGFWRSIVLFATAMSLIGGMFLGDAQAANDGKFAKLDNGLTIHYEEAGEGLPVIFIPGWTLTTEFFSKQLEGLAGTNRVITYDPRSHGLSTKTPLRNDYMQHGADLAAFIDSLGLKKVVLAGWSFGCLDAYAYVRQFGTDRLAGFVCIDLSPKPTKAAKEDWGSFDGLGSMGWWYSGLTSDQVRLSTFKGFTEWMVKREATKDEINWVRNQAFLTPTYAAIQTLTDTFFADYTAEAKILNDKVPYMNIVRTEVEAAAKSWLKANAPKSQVAVFSNHMMFWTDPAEFNETMAKFLKMVK